MIERGGKREAEKEEGRERERARGGKEVKVRRRPALLAHPRFHAVVPLSSSLLLACVVHGRASAARAGSLDNLSVRS